jgi:hypothetical protein
MSDDANAITAPTLPVQPILLPTIQPVSGLYTWQDGPIAIGPLPVAAAGPTAGPIAVPGPALPGPILAIRREELRIDVDGRYPQMTASGIASTGLSGRVAWIASLTPAAGGGWSGSIWFKDGLTSLFGYTTISITVQRPNIFVAPVSATVQFSGGGPAYTRVYNYASRYFHTMNMEFDCAAGSAVNLDFNTASHPNRPASLPHETLTIQEVFKRAGFDVTTSAGNSTVPMSGAGANLKWSNQEMHDAMQVHWSQNAAQAKWAVWVFFASLSEQGTSLGGIMFDDIGAQQRQGTAIFNDSFIKTPPAGEPLPTQAAWIDRMNFWTACHETGHTFNLAHSWQKALVSGGKGPWIPMTNLPEARTFMNYPYNVSGSTPAFFANFDYRFIDQELLFMRHAPERFVEQGNALWFDHHGFEQANVPQQPALQFEITIDKPSASYEFLEPVVLEMRLTNVSDEPQLIPENVLKSLERVTAVVKRDGDPAKLYAPYAHYCYHSNKIALNPGQSISESLFISAGSTGWSISEPGFYTIQLALDHGDEEIVSNVMRVRVCIPNDRDEERLAQDYFSDHVGRIMAFDGSTFLTAGNGVLQSVVDRLPQRNAAIHCAVPLALTMGSQTHALCYDDNGPKLVKTNADVAAATASLAPLMGDSSRAIATLGALDYDYYVARLGNLLTQAGAPNVAARLTIRGEKASKPTGSTPPSRKRTNA